MTSILMPELFPFLISSGLVLALLLLEIVLILSGLSGSMDAPELSDMPELDITAMSAPELAAEFDVSPEMAAEIAAELGGVATADSAVTGPDTGGAGGAGLAQMIGLGTVPLTIWLVIFLALFSSAGLMVQTGLFAAIGQMLPRIIAIPLALVPALFLTRRVAGFINRVIPRDETAAISETRLGRHRGTLTVGTARRGSPAQVRISDVYGNIHYVMLEPLGDSDEITEGQSVLVLRLPGGLLRIVALG